MGAFAKSVVTGFAFSLGAALFRKISPQLGLDDKGGKKDAEKASAAGEGDAADGDGADGAEPSPLAHKADAAIAWIGRTARRTARGQ